MLKIIDQKINMDVLKIFEKTGAIMKGHFKLTSGYHSEYYLQCAKLLQYPDITYKIVDELQGVVGKDVLGKTNTIISPAVGAIVFGYMLAYVSNKKMIFAERKNEKMELRRGFEIQKNERIIIAEDVITTGGSVKEIIEICNERGAQVEAVVSIVDRSEKTDFNVPYHYVIKFEIDKYDPSECPLCKDNLELYYPGSRNILR